MLRELLLKGLVLANIELKEAASILGVKQKEIREEYFSLMKLPPAGKLELIFSAPSETNRKFLKMCFYGGRKFVDHFLGRHQMSPKEMAELMMKVETDPQVVARFGKLMIDYEKLDMQKKKEEKKGAEEILDMLRSLSSSIEPGDLS